MGWGHEPHEGWTDEKLPDGRWLASTSRRGVLGPVAYQAVCTCGWRSAREHAVPPRPDAPRRGSEDMTWLQALDTAENACWDDWNAEHFAPLLGYEPHTQLILGRTDGGARHFLNGRPVHAGATLELLLERAAWLPIRYEWNWQEGTAPTAYAAAGLPDDARSIADPPLIRFELPPLAVLRWPEPS